MKKKVFLICPVRNISEETKEKIAEYVKNLESQGYIVHWPLRDTNQDDPTGGFEICRTNCLAMIESDEIHIWYDFKSTGSLFDEGGVFMLVEMLGWKKKIVIANEGQFEVLGKGKDFYWVFKRLIEKQKRNKI